LLRFRGNTRRDSSMLLPATCGSTLQRERIVAFPWQQWLRERATVLPYTYIACVVRSFAQSQSYAGNLISSSTSMI
jgi:hypothetical protein